MQTLYIHNKPVILRTPEESVSNNFILLKSPDRAGFLSELNRLKEEDISGYQIITKHPEEVIEALLSNFQYYPAAGGLVTDTKNGDILLMFRRGKWDLPKGKMESNETPEETALREVSEETGLKNIKIIKKLTDTWHSYPVSVYGDANKDTLQRDILKQTHWFQMVFTGNELTIPQIEEDIVDIQWIKPENIKKYLDYSYPNIRDVFKTVSLF